MAGDKKMLFRVSGIQIERYNNPGGFFFSRSLRVTQCKLEPMLGAAKPASVFNFERMGYFCADIKDSKPGAPVFNRVVTLKDTWAKIEKSSK